MLYYVVKRTKYFVFVSGLHLRYGRPQDETNIIRLKITRALFPTVFEPKKIIISFTVTVCFSWMSVSIWLRWPALFCFLHIQDIRRTTT